MTKKELLQNAKPVLFNAQMVKAILDGRKTVTRRVIKRDITNYCDVDVDGALLNYENSDGDFINPVNLSRYQKGDILYVRETWTYHENAVGGIIFKARCPKKLAENKKWKPSIHMPKEAARIFLKVKNVKVEKLQDMTIKDCEKEGVFCGNNGDIFAFRELWDSTIKKNDLEQYGYDANPWVWVIEFEKLEVKP